MSQDNAVRILNDPKFARNLKKWNNEKKIRQAARGIDFSKDGSRDHLHRLVAQKPHLFEHERALGKTAWEICHTYYNKLASYVLKR